MNIIDSRRTGAVFSSDLGQEIQDSLLDARSVWEEATQAIFKHRPLGIIRRRKKSKRRHSDNKRKDSSQSNAAAVQSQGYDYPFATRAAGEPAAVYLTPIHPHQHHQQILPAPGHSYFDAMIQSQQVPQSPYMMAATGTHNSYHMPGHPILHAGVPQYVSRMPASSPVFVIHMPKPPMAAPYDPLILGGIPEGMIPVHPLQQLIENLQQQAEASNDRDANMHQNHMTQAKEVLTGRFSDPRRDEIENRKDADGRELAGSKDDFNNQSQKSGNMSSADLGGNDSQNYNYDDVASSTPFPGQLDDVRPYEPRFDTGETQPGPY